MNPALPNYHPFYLNIGELHVIYHQQLLAGIKKKGSAG